MMLKKTVTRTLTLQQVMSKVQENAFRGLILLSLLKDLEIKTYLTTSTMAN